MFLVLAALLQVTPGAEAIAIQEARVLLEERISNLEGGTLFLEQFLITFPDRVATPTTGMVVDSPPEVDDTGLHQIIVRSVFTDGPADQAGIEPGDRTDYSPSSAVHIG